MGGSFNLGNKIYWLDLYTLEDQWGFVDSEGHWHIRNDDTEEKEAKEDLPELEGANVGHHRLTRHQTVAGGGGKQRRR